MNGRRRSAAAGVPALWWLLASCTDPVAVDGREPNAAHGPDVAASAASQAGATRLDPMTAGRHVAPAPAPTPTPAPAEPAEPAEQNIFDPDASSPPSAETVGSAPGDAASLAELASLALGDGDARVRADAVYAIGAMRSSGGVPVLERALVDPAPAVRRAAVESLVAIGGANVRDALDRATHDIDPAVRGLALDTITEDGLADGG